MYFGGAAVHISLRLQNRTVELLVTNRHTCDAQGEDDVILSSGELVNGLDPGSASAADSDYDVRSQGRRDRRSRRRGAGGGAHGTQNRSHRFISDRPHRNQPTRGEPERPARSARLQRREAQRRARGETGESGRGREGLRKRRRLRYNAEESDVEMSISDDGVASDDEDSEVQHVSWTLY